MGRRDLPWLQMNKKNYSCGTGFGILRAEVEDVFVS